MKKLLKKALVSAAAAAAVGTSAFAASGQTDVSFNFPNIVILHYVSDVTFDVPASAFGSDSIADSSAKTLSSFTSPDTVGGDATVSVTAATALDAYKGVIQNAWAVRGLAGAAGIDVSITINTADATNGSSTVTISNATVDDGTNSGASITIASPGLSAANAHYGDVKFDIDFSGVTAPGTHSGAQYTVTATAN